MVLFKGTHLRFDAGCMKCDDYGKASLIAQEAKSLIAFMYQLATWLKLVQKNLGVVNGKSGQ